MITLSKGLCMEKEINNFPGYTVDDKGRVFSNQRRYTTKNNISGAKPRRIELKQGKFWTGYKRVTLIDSTGKTHTKAVHRLVATTLIPNPEKKPQVNHIDGNKQNNNVDNLEWVTRQENRNHATENKLWEPQYGSQSHFAKINENDVSNIITEMIAGKPNSDIANKYGLHDRYVSLIRHKKRWPKVWENFKDVELPNSNKQPEYKDTNRSSIDIDTQLKIIEELKTSTNKAVADKYNLDPSVMSRVRAGKSWKLANKMSNDYRKDK